MNYCVKETRIPYSLNNKVKYRDIHTYILERKMSPSTNYKNGTRRTPLAQTIFLIMCKKH